jgi:TIR domain
LHEWSVSVMRRVFISYRRSSSSMAARLLASELRKRGCFIFMDVESLRQGDFRDAILSEIRAATDFVPILSPGSLDTVDVEGDWFGLEVTCALDARINIVPVLLDGFQWPGAPNSHLVARLSEFNSVVLTHDYFSAGVDRLAAFLGPPHQARVRGLPRGVVAVGGVVATACLAMFLWPSSQTSPPPAETKGPSGAKSEQAAASPHIVASNQRGTTELEDAALPVQRGVALRKFIGDAKNLTSNRKLSGFDVEIRRGAAGAARAEGGFDNLTLWGRFSIPGREVSCTDVGDQCLSFKGEINLGQDGSEYPDGTVTSFEMYAAIAADELTGTYTVGPLPTRPYAQKGSLSLRLHK